MTSPTRALCGATGRRARLPSSRADLKAECDTTNPNGAEAHTPARIFELIKSKLARDFAEQITLRDIEKASGYSVYQIIRTFRQRVGTTPHAYLMRIRIQYAAARLMQGDTIAVAAAEAGFADQSHMTRHFKRVFGMTPKQFLLCRREMPMAHDVSPVAVAPRSLERNPEPRQKIASDLY
jgi:AraC-like DNA-binding protein